MVIQNVWVDPCKEFLFFIAENHIFIDHEIAIFLRKMETGVNNALGVVQSFLVGIEQLQSGYGDLL